MVVSLDVGRQRARMLSTRVPLRRAGVGPACITRNVETNHAAVVDRLLVLLQRSFAMGLWSPYRKAMSTEIGRIQRHRVSSTRH